jgi:penicillin-binding protein 2
MHKNKAEKEDFILSEIIRDDQIDNKYGKRVIDHMAINNSGQNDFVNLSITNYKINAVLFLILLAMASLFVRVSYLQVVKGSYYKEVAEGNRIRVETIKASRGLIYDRNNNLLVKNIPNFTVLITKGDLPKKEEDLDKVITKISDILKIRKTEILMEIDKATLWQPITITENLPYGQALEIIIEANNMPGVKCQPIAIREYNDSIYMSHILGYIGKINQEELEQFKSKNYLVTDYIGKSGLESYYEDKLKGTDGRKQIEINSQGEEIKVIAEEEGSPGNNLVLTLDSELQKMVYDTIENIAEEQNSKGASAIVLDPRNGEILALVSWPGYDTNEFVKGIEYDKYQFLLNDERKPLFNKTIAGEYPSGSVFKPVVASAALQEGVITENTTVNSVGGITIHGYNYPDWKAGGHGVTNVTKALADSVNTFFYIAGGGTYIEETNTIEGGLGLENINHYAELFGLNNISGIDLAGEKSGFLPTREWKRQAKKEDWYIGDTYHLAIGQGDILVTPLQVANYTAAVANGGTLYKPHLLQQEMKANNQFIEKNKTQVLHANFISKENIAIVQKGMREAVTYGSAKKLQNVSVPVAAKTGTAQHTGTGNNHSWLTAFAPYDNPEIVVTVIVEEGGEGTEAALPAVSEILNWYFAN